MLVIYTTPIMATSVQDSRIQVTVKLGTLKAVKGTLPVDSNQDKKASVPKNIK
jgi:hypothetical protein